MDNNITVAQAWERIRQEVRNDEDYYLTVYANVRMPILDMLEDVNISSTGRHMLATFAAENIMDIFYPKEKRSEQLEDCTTV